MTVDGPPVPLLAPVQAVSANPYDHPVYLAASAAHVGAALEPLPGGLTLLRARTGWPSWTSVYGYPQAADPVAAAAALRALDVPWSVTLAALPGPGAELCAALGGGETAVASRSLALAPLQADADPLETCLDARGRRSARRALRDGAVATVGPPDPEVFGPFYRAAMDALGADPIYRFDDAYFGALAAVPSYLVTVRDAHGIAAMALWLDGDPVASYHLGGRRTAPDPVPGAMHVALLEGLREAARRGRSAGLLGGGRTPAPDDPLLAFKAQLAPARVDRLTFSG